MLPMHFQRGRYAQIRRLYLYIMYLVYQQLICNLTIVYIPYKYSAPIRIVLTCVYSVGTDIRVTPHGTHLKKRNNEINIKSCISLSTLIATTISPTTNIQFTQVNNAKFDILIYHHILIRLLRIVRKKCTPLTKQVVNSGGCYSTQADTVSSSLLLLLYHYFSQWPCSFHVFSVSYLTIAV